jgi:hypothetical protein
LPCVKTTEIFTLLMISFAAHIESYFNRH